MKYKIMATANNVESESTTLTIGEGVYKFDLSFIVKGKKYRIKNVPDDTTVDIFCKMAKELVDNTDKYGYEAEAKCLKEEVNDN